MTVMSNPELTVENLVSAHRSLRQKDQDFDKMCRDFEILKTDLAALPVREADDAVPAVEADIRESLSGLEQEIRRWVAENGQPRK